jgi:Ca2+-binding RTX toxin-like protein
MAIIHGNGLSEGGRVGWFDYYGLVGTDEDDRIYGHGGDDWIAGGDGDDRIDGGSGADVMVGDGGNDTYVVDDAGDEVHESTDPGAGSDAVAAYVSYTLPAGVEALALYDVAAARNGTGNGLDNSITGNSYANRLEGLDGDDTLSGLAGSDTLYGGAGLDTLYGGADGDELFGDADADTLYGGSGNDELDGGSGADTMYGGRDDDTYFVQHNSDQVVENVGEGRDTVFSTLGAYTLTANVEDLVLEGYAADGTGNASDNQIVGNERGNTLIGMGGSDTLYGMGGNDLLIGGLGSTDNLHGGSGNDDYVVRDSLDIVHENAREGIDTVTATVDYVLTANVENLILQEGSFGAGNSLDNSLTGNKFANTLNGQGGADTMRGLGGDDTYVVDNAGDVVIEAAGDGYDIVTTSVSFTAGANNSIERIEAVQVSTSTAVINLVGNGLANAIVGNAGSSLLDGGAGNDTLTGGQGQDYFRFSSALGSGNRDTITDFDAANDTIYLENGIFTQLVTSGNLARDLSQAEFHIGTAAHDADDRIIYNSQTGALLYDADGTGAIAAVEFANVGADEGLTAVDFLVI